MPGDDAKFSSVPIRQTDFDWNATNLSQEFSAFKRICKSLLEDGPYSDLSEKQNCDIAELVRSDCLSVT